MCLWIHIPVFVKNFHGKQQHEVAPVVLCRSMHPVVKLHKWACQYTGLHRAFQGVHGSQEQVCATNASQWYIPMNNYSACRAIQCGARSGSPQLHISTVYNQTTKQLAWVTKSSIFMYRILKPFILSEPVRIKGQSLFREVSDWKCAVNRRNWRTRYWTCYVINSSSSSVKAESIPAVEKEAAVEILEAVVEVEKEVAELSKWSSWYSDSSVSSLFLFTVGQEVEWEVELHVGLLSLHLNSESCLLIAF